MAVMVAMSHVHVGGADPRGKPRKGNGWQSVVDAASLRQGRALLCSD